MRSVKQTALVICLTALALTAATRPADAQEHWVATWAASPQAPRFNIPRPPTPAATPQAQGNPAPAFPAPPAINDLTVRMVARSSIGGRRVRIQLSNAFGTAPLKVGSAHIALRDKGSAIVAGSDRALTFSGRSSFAIPPAAEALSDAVDLDVPKLSDLLISVYVPEEVAAPTMHLTGLHTTYISKSGDFTGAPSIAELSTTQTWYWLSSVDVLAPAEDSLIVAFGDSITDGATSTADANMSWPSQLAERLQAIDATAGLAIVNQGISGNRLLHDGAGISALARFDRDVLSQPGVKWVIVLEGINDIGVGTQAGAAAADAVTADDLIAAHKQMIERAHVHGIKAVGATLTPYEGARYYSEDGEKLRQAVNQWIRTSKAYDAVIDFDAVTRDPDNPKQIRPMYNIRDHLHPNDLGYRLMAEAVDLSMFVAKPAPADSR
ncbi:MAG TPA: SGNH/GDSL hydrolase family protein [Bryobacteraceae bacterium]|nr:SGNH/GDSL hydrolase family protein [Bryobacteraceae bacterium]